MLNLIDVPQVVSLPDESGYQRTVNPVVEGWMDRDYILEILGDQLGVHN